MADVKHSFRTGNMWYPQAYPIALPFVMDFGTLDEHVIELESQQSRDQLDFVQTIYIDNADNLNPLTVTLPGGQRLVIPASAQGYYPAVCEWGKFVAKFETTPAADLVVNAMVLNVPVASEQWGPIVVNVAQVVATFTPTVGTFADHSGSVAVAGTSQTLFAANANAIRRVVQNNSTESIWINFGAAAAQVGVDSIEILAGATFDTATGPIDQTEWTVIAAGTPTYIAKEMA